MRLILASASPRRRELIALLGLPFTSISTDIDETVRPGEPPDEYVRRMSREKADAAAGMVEGPALILAVDTTVVDGSEVLGKPRDAAEAESILRRLRGRSHRVLSALTLLDTATGRRLTQLADSPVSMRRTTDEEIAATIRSGDPFDKAGAYAIRNAHFHPVEGFEHCIANVMGLPLRHVTRMLRQIGAAPPADIAATCQAHLGCACPMYRRILVEGE